MEYYSSRVVDLISGNFDLRNHTDMLVCMEDISKGVYRYRFGNVTDNEITIAKWNGK